MSSFIPIGPGVESVALDIYAAAPGSARWDRSTWGGAPWSTPAWQAVECQATEVTTKWGAVDEAGILSTAEAGELDIRTYDPGRVLDPLNSASAFYGAVRPGTPIRLQSNAGAPVATAFLDIATYDLAAATGRIRAIDGIAYLAQAQVPEGTVLPNTLRARVRAIVSAVGLGSIVPVQGETASGNVVPIGGAEGYPEAYNTMPNGWRIWGAVGGSTATLGTSGNAVRTGTRAYNLRLTGGTDVLFSNDAMQSSQPVVGGGTYRLEGYRLREGWGGNQILRVFIGAMDTAGNYLGDTEATARLEWNATDAGVWLYRSAPWVAPANAGSVFLFYRVQNAGDSDWLDDVAIVGPVPGTELPTDPAVAPYDGKARSAWEAITDAALDALVYVWLGPGGVLRFTSWGSFPDASIAIGCEDPAAPGGTWIEGISTIDTAAQADGIRNSVRAYASAGTYAAAIQDAPSIARYGIRAVDVQRVVPNYATWAGRILTDRADAGLQVTTGEIRPYTDAELAALLDLQNGGPASVRIRDDSHGELVDLTVATIGGQVGITPAGWRFGWVTMIPRAEWESVDPEPPIPPEPPTDPWHVETRTYIASSDALIALTSGGSNYGAGAATSLPVGSWSGWQYRGLIQLPSIPTTKVRALRTATLKLVTSDQVRVGFGSSPTIELRRITGSWSAGSSSSPSSGNAVVWPGPSTTSSGAVRANVTGSQNAAVAIRCDAIARSWLPSSAGGSSAAQRGIALYAGSGSTADTTEFWPVEKGGSNRPTLELVLEIFD